MYQNESSANQEKQACIISYETRKANMKEINWMQCNPTILQDKICQRNCLKAKKIFEVLLKHDHELDFDRQIRLQSSEES